MAEKLKSILRRIHLSLPRKSIRGLILRAAVFAAAWLVLPWWLFLLVAAYCYFIPLFLQGKLLIPFFCLMVLTFVQTPNFLFALVFGVVFYCLLLIKDFLIINRRFAYEILVLALSFFLIRDFFKGYDGLHGSAFFGAFWLAVAIGLLMYSMMRFFAGEALGKGNMRIVASWLVTLLSWQIILIGLFLPLDFIYQSIVVFVATTFFCELIAGYFWSDLSREKIFVTASVFFALLVILLASVPWGIT